MKTLLNGWTPMRGFRLLIGLAIMIQGIYSGDVLTLVLGAVFMVMALANVGCCGGGSCPVKPYNKSLQKTTDHDKMDTP